MEISDLDDRDDDERDDDEDDDDANEDDLEFGPSDNANHQRASDSNSDSNEESGPNESELSRREKLELERAI